MAHRHNDTSGSEASPAVDLSSCMHKHVFVGVCGGISAYKICHVVSRLAQAGADVTVAMTDAAQRFVGPLTFQALSAKPVITDVFEHVSVRDDGRLDPQHVSLARSVDVAIVAPCTMDCLARLAHGHASDPVCLVLSAVDLKRTPILLAPAMNAAMWGQASTKRNVETLKADGFVFVGPDSGWQACRTDGEGRMAEPDEILARVAEICAGQPN